jgi:hypothetical protein
MQNGFGKRVLTLYAEPKNSLLLDHDMDPLPRWVNVPGPGLEQNLEPHVFSQNCTPLLRKLPPS